jgi:FKBP-type peptidyl-prolyl cis-trans isomerase
MQKLATLMTNYPKKLMKQAYYCILICSILSSCSVQNKTSATKTAEIYISTTSGLKYTILKQGSGVPVKEGDQVLIFETTSYRNGTVLYSNENSTTPVKVLVGGNQATDGVDEGLRGMQVGEIRKLITPPYLVKRKSYPENVSPDSTLVIKIILHKIL